PAPLQPMSADEQLMPCRSSFHLPGMEPGGKSARSVLLVRWVIERPSASRRIVRPPRIVVRGQFPFPQGAGGFDIAPDIFHHCRFLFCLPRLPCRAIAGLVTLARINASFTPALR